MLFGEESICSKQYVSAGKHFPRNAENSNEVTVDAVSRPNGGGI